MSLTASMASQEQAMHKVSYPIFTSLSRWKWSLLLDQLNNKWQYFRSVPICVRHLIPVGFHQSEPKAGAKWQFNTCTSEAQPDSTDQLFSANTKIRPVPVIYGGLLDVSMHFLFMCIFNGFIRAPRQLHLVISPLIGKRYQGQVCKPAVTTSLHNFWTSTATVVP